MEKLDPGFDPDALEAALGYRFTDRSLLLKALTHTSYANEHKGQESYERLEFLGDAVLEMVTSAFLYTTYPRMREGEMTKLRATLVCEPALAFCAHETGLTDYLLLGRGEEAGGGRQKDSIIADIVEALIGAMYIDSGMDVTAPKRFILAHILNDVEGRRLFYDAKSILQEKAQTKGLSVRYELVSEEGPAHDKSFVSSVFIGEVRRGTGSGRSKKLSEQQAAFAALQEEWTG